MDKNRHWQIGFLIFIVFVQLICNGLSARLPDHNDIIEHGDTIIFDPEYPEWYHVQFTMTDTFYLKFNFIAPDSVSMTFEPSSQTTFFESYVRNMDFIIRPNSELIIKDSTEIHMPSNKSFKIPLGAKFKLLGGKIYTSEPSGL